MVVVLGAAAGGGPLGAAMLLGLLQELVQTERVLLKLHRAVTARPVVGTGELTVWNKPGGRSEVRRDGWRETGKLLGLGLSF